MDKFEFTPKKGFEDASAYPDPISESETREQLMRPSKQLADYINKDVFNAIVSISGASGNPDAIGQIQKMLNDYKTNVDDALKESKHVFVTKDAYSALGDADKNNGSIYFIGD
jgi:hypothetical protein|nr:MAG TPA: hypothetical protein [Bacteriophage sp.]